MSLLSQAQKERLSPLLEICDDQAKCNRLFLERGLLSQLAPGEARTYPIEERDWICMYCATADSKCVLRLPASTGDLGKLFLVEYIAFIAHQEGGHLTVGLQNTSGSNN
jgi:hypothetical protein